MLAEQHREVHASGVGHCSWFAGELVYSTNAFDTLKVDSGCSLMVYFVAARRSGSGFFGCVECNTRWRKGGLAGSAFIPCGSCAWPLLGDVTLPGRGFDIWP